MFHHDSLRKDVGRYLLRDSEELRREWNDDNPECTVSRSKWIQLMRELYWIREQPKHPRMADKEYLAFKLYLNALHDAQVRYACRRDPAKGPSKTA